MWTAKFVFYNVFRCFAILCSIFCRLFGHRRGCAIAAPKTLREAVLARLKQPAWPMPAHPAAIGIPISLFVRLNGNASNVLFKGASPR